MQSCASPADRCSSWVSVPRVEVCVAHWLSQSLAFEDCSLTARRTTLRAAHKVFFVLSWETFSMSKVRMRNAEVPNLAQIRSEYLDMAIMVINVF